MIQSRCTGKRNLADNLRPHVQRRIGITPLVEWQSWPLLIHSINILERDPGHVWSGWLSTPFALELCNDNVALLRHAALAGCSAWQPRPLGCSNDWRFVRSDVAREAAALS